MIHIFFASRLVLEKGVDILIRTIEETLSHTVLSSSVMWHIASDGEYRDSIIELSRKYPESVFYSGNLSPEAMSEHYRAADLLYMPSRFLETFGLTALESLACGTPVIGMRK